MGETDSVRGDVRRWGDRAWDVTIRIMGFVLSGICIYGATRISEAEKKIQALEVRAAVNDTEKAQILMALGEIKADVKAIKAKINVP